MKELERVFVLENCREHLTTLCSPSQKFSAAQCCANLCLRSFIYRAVLKGKIAPNQKLEHPMAIPDGNQGTRKKEKKDQYSD